jgi:hypothetical protein
MTDYHQVLRDLENREAELRDELRDIEAAKPAIQRMADGMAKLVFAQSPPPPYVSATEPQFPTTQAWPPSFQGPFAGMGTKEAILALLNGISGPLSVAEIATSLLRGGIKTNSQDFAAVVKSTMANLKSEGRVERKEDGWAALKPDSSPNAFSLPSLQ